MFTDDDRQQRLRFGRDVAHRAGVLARRYFEREVPFDVARKGAHDYVTAADTAVETLIREAVAQSFPGDQVFGEEHGGKVGPRTWVVDPIDGTANFVRGVRYYCVSIAFVADGVRQVAVIHDPSAGEMFWAARGQGAWCNERRLEVSDCPYLTHAYLANGYVPRHGIDRYLAMRRRMLEAGAVAKDMGAGALMLAHVAAGRYDGFYEPHMHAWDALAGLLLIEEAGGVVAPYPGELGMEGGGEVIAAGPGLFPGLLRLVRG